MAPLWDAEHIFDLLGFQLTLDASAASMQQWLELPGVAASLKQALRSAAKKQTREEASQVVRQWLSDQTPKIESHAPQMSAERFWGFLHPLLLRESSRLPSQEDLLAMREDLVPGSDGNGSMSLMPPPPSAGRFLLSDSSDHLEEPPLGSSDEISFQWDVASDQIDAWEGVIGGADAPAPKNPWIGLSPEQGDEATEAPLLIDGTASLEDLSAVPPERLRETPPPPSPNGRPRPGRTKPGRTRPQNTRILPVVKTQPSELVDSYEEMGGDLSAYQVSPPPVSSPGPAANAGASPFDGPTIQTPFKAPTEPPGLAMTADMVPFSALEEAGADSASGSSPFSGSFTPSPPPEVSNTQAELDAAFDAAFDTGEDDQTAFDFGSEATGEDAGEQTAFDIGTDGWDDLSFPDVQASQGITPPTLEEEPPPVPGFGSGLFGGGIFSQDGAADGDGATSGLTEVGVPGVAVEMALQKGREKMQTPPQPAPPEKRPVDTLPEDPPLELTEGLEFDSTFADPSEELPVIQGTAHSQDNTQASLHPLTASSVDLDVVVGARVVDRSSTAPMDAAPEPSDPNGAALPLMLNKKAAGFGLHSSSSRKEKSPMYIQGGKDEAHLLDEMPSTPTPILRSKKLRMVETEGIVKLTPELLEQFEQTPSRLPRIALIAAGVLLLLGAVGLGLYFYLS